MKKIILIGAILLAGFQIVFGQSEETVNAGIVNGKAIDLPPPVYSRQAKDSCAGGKVEVEVLIDEKGGVLDAKAISGDASLRDAAVEAAKRAKFSQTPHLIAKIRGILIYNFDGFVKCIDAGIVNKKALILPKPKVTDLKRRRLSGLKKEHFVAIEVIIDLNGKVLEARGIGAHSMFREICENAARRAKFPPTNANMPPIRIKALLVYKLKIDKTFDTQIEADDKDVIGTPLSLIEPQSPFCNCRFGGPKPVVFVEAKTDEKGNVTEAKALSGHPLLRISSEKAALKSKFLPTNQKAKLSIRYNFEALDEDSRAVKFSSAEIKAAVEK